MTVLDTVQWAIIIGFFTFMALFGIVIPAYVFRKAKKVKGYDTDSVWDKGAVGIFAFLLLCTVLTFFSTFIFKHGIFVFVAGVLFLVLLISFFFALDSAGDDSEEAYMYSMFAAVIYFAVAMLFVNGKLFNRVSMFVEPLRAAGFNDKSISLYVFTPVYALGYFSYAHLADESLDHTQWLLGILQTEFINMRRANDYLRNTEGAITASSVTNLDKLNKWKNLHSGDVIVSKSGASHALYVDAAAKLEVSLGVSFKTIMARTCIMSDSPFPDSWMPFTEIRESLDVTEEELDAMLYPAPDSQMWKRVQSGGDLTYHGSYFILGEDGKIEINYVAQRLEKLLARLKELGYPHHMPSVDIRLLYLGNVSMRAYANVSPEHEEALVNLLERTIQELEGGTRKRGKNKAAA